MLRKISQSSVLGVLLLELVSACGSKTARGRTSPTEPVGPDTGASGVGGAAVAGSCPGPVRCLDAKTASFCNEQGEREAVDCAAAMAEQGIESSGCSSDDKGAGCTIDAFVDPECEAGTAPFAVCAGLGEQDLVNTYVACFQNLSEASPTISCYRDYVDEAAKLVDCGSARTVCAL